MPPLAVWAGEVVLIAGPTPDVLVSVVRALQAGARGRVRAASVALRTEPDAAARVLAAAACVAAVVAAVPAGSDASARHAVEALRRAVARLAPCRCVWVAHGRTYPW